MIGLDTNVLLRILVGDDPAQVTVVRKLLASKPVSGAFFVNHIVLAECAWALQGAYKMNRSDIVRGFQGLLDTPAFAVEEPETVTVALTHYQQSTADFADCLIAARNAATGCAHTATFDKKMRDLPAVKVLS